MCHKNNRNKGTAIKKKKRLPDAFVKHNKKHFFSEKIVPLC